MAGKSKHNKVTLGQITEWSVEGKKNGATHLLVLFDLFTDTFKPEYVYPEDSLELVTKSYDEGLESIVKRIEL